MDGEQYWVSVVHGAIGSRMCWRVSLATGRLWIVCWVTLDWDTTEGKPRSLGSWSRALSHHSGALCSGLLFFNTHKTSWWPGLATLNDNSDPRHQGKGLSHKGVDIRVSRLFSSGLTHPSPSQSVLPKLLLFSQPVNDAGETRLWIRNRVCAAALETRRSQFYLSLTSQNILTISGLRAFTKPLWS